MFKYNVNDKVKYYLYKELGIVRVGIINRKIYIEDIKETLIFYNIDGGLRLVEEKDIIGVVNV